MKKKYNKDVGASAYQTILGYPRPHKLHKNTPHAKVQRNRFIELFTK